MSLRLAIPEGSRRGWRSRLLASASVLFVLIGAAGCARRPSAWPPGTLLPETCCPNLPGRGEPGATITFGLTASVRPENAPLPENAAEAIVFRNLYESLVDVDCRGRVVPALAAYWTSSEDGRRWTFTLHRDARFWDGTRVVAADVKSSWSARRRRLRLTNRLDWPWDEVRPRAVEILDDRRLAVTLPTARPDFPHLLAQPAFAVTRSLPDERWPCGTACLRVDAENSSDQEITLLPAGSPWAPLRSPERIVFRIQPDSDPRDMLAEGVDVALAQDRTTVSYLGRRVEYTTTPLPWSRLHVLLLPKDDGTAAIIREERANLARDVTLSDAIPWDTAFLESMVISCAPRTIVPTPLSPAESVRVRGRVIHPEADRDARPLAERIAFLLGAATDGAPPPIAGLPRAEFRRALAHRDGVAVVLPLARRFATDCLQSLELLHAAPWLSYPSASGETAPESDPTDLVTRLVANGWVTPLVATRTYLVTRTGLTGVWVGYDGIPRLESAGWIVEGNLP